jgi:hypothetical protein
VNYNRGSKEITGIQTIIKATQNRLHEQQTKQVTFSENILKKTITLTVVDALPQL